MDISNEKISELLKNPEVIGMIASLAGNMGLGNGLKNAMPAEISAPEAEKISDEASIPAMSESVLQQMPAALLPDGASGLGSGDRRVALLNAIKPYVSQSKKQRLDGLVKAISVAGILNNYTGGLFGTNKQ